MQGNRKTGTRPEVAVRQLLHGSGLRYRKNARVVLPELSTTPDIVFARPRVAVFIDGCFWHGCEEHHRTPRSNAAYWEAKIARNRARDQNVNEALTKAGWEVLRVWEHVPPRDAAETIRQRVRARQLAAT